MVPPTVAGSSEEGMVPPTVGRALTHQLIETGKPELSDSSTDFFSQTTLSDQGSRGPHGMSTHICPHIPGCGILSSIHAGETSTTLTDFGQRANPFLNFSVKSHLFGPYSRTSFPSVRSNELFSESIAAFHGVGVPLGQQF